MPNADPNADPNALVTVAQAKSDFEANMLVTILAEAGIEARAFAGVQQALPLNSRLLRVPVQVRASELEQARAALAQNVADSVDLDWDEVDVGEREDDLPLGEPGRMPSMAILAFVMTLIIALLAIVAMFALIFA